MYKMLKYFNLRIKSFFYLEIELNFEQINALKLS